MSSTTAPPPTSTGAVATSTATGLFGLIENGAGNVDTQKYQNQSVWAFFSSLVVSVVVFFVQFAVFLLIKDKLPRIFRPRTYLVPEREQTNPPPSGPWRWIVPVFRTSNSEYIQKCGLDAYFFLRYLRMLLRIFVPTGCFLLLILLPLNAVGGKGPDFQSGAFASQDFANTNVSGLNVLGWGNVNPDQHNRYWAHLLLAIGVIAYCCFVFFDELRSYVRLRQAYLTSPQHRLRASATTVLVSGIPRKWCTAQALQGLYDVFPGGVKNIWLNRNMKELADKVDQRNTLATKLEQAETALIRNAKKAHIKKLRLEAKKAGRTQSKQEQADEKKRQDDKGAAMANSRGDSAGNIHQTHHTLEGVLDDAASSASSRASSRSRRRKMGGIASPLGAVGDGIGAVGQGITSLGKSVFGGLKNVGKEVDSAITTTQGFQQLEQPAGPSSSDVPRANGGVEQGRTPSRPPTATDPEKPRATATAETPDSKKESGVDAWDHATPKDSVQDGSLAPLEPSITQAEEEEGEGGGGGELEAPAKKGAAHFGGLDGAESVNTERKSHTVPLKRKTPVTFWRSEKDAIQVPSPRPAGHVEQDNPFDKPRTPRELGSALAKTVSSAAASGPSASEGVEYPPAIDPEYDANAGEEEGEGEQPVWKKYLRPKDRETMKLPAFGFVSWFTWIPFLFKKVDTIDHCRRELARLNVEIEQDQKEPERFPLMNSAFIQFNHQVAAHMACQSVSHHIANNMTPRVVEISPDDVIWDNMSMKWWQRYIMTFVVVVITTGLVILWFIPVALTGLLSQISSLYGIPGAQHALENLPPVAISVIQGVAPPAVLALLLFLLPLIMRTLAKLQGVSTGTAIELEVSNYYFFFLFVQVFLVVTLSSSLTSLLSSLSASVSNVPLLLARSLPGVATYFISYIILQGLSVGAGVLLQIAQLFSWFLLAPIFDKTARAKFQRQIGLFTIDWGTFFPFYTNLAVIAIIYSVITPLILIFTSITMALFYMVYRYNTLYVTKFERDTGGLLFPKAVNQLFVGLYFLELCMIGLFLIVPAVAFDAKGEAYVTGGSPPCLPQAIIMIVVLVGTAAYQWLLNKDFGPLFRYLPITLEDEAVIRDEEFARAQERKFLLAGEEEERELERAERRLERPAEGGMFDGANDEKKEEEEGEEEEKEGQEETTVEDILEARERRSQEEDRAAEEADARDIEERRRSRRFMPDAAKLAAAAGAYVPEAVTRVVRGAAETIMPATMGVAATTNPQKRGSSANWAHRQRSASGGAVPAVDAANDDNDDNSRGEEAQRIRARMRRQLERQRRRRRQEILERHQLDGAGSGTGSGRGDDSAAVEAQTGGKDPLSHALFAGMHDEMEDLSPEERDALVRRAFQHSALRARRPVVWIPQDDLGVSSDEIERTRRLTMGNVWISNEYAALDAKARVVFSRPPPDYSVEALIKL